MILRVLAASVATEGFGAAEARAVKAASAMEERIVRSLIMVL